MTTGKYAVSQDWINRHVQSAAQTATPGRMEGFINRQSNAANAHLDRALSLGASPVQRTQAITQGAKRSGAMASGMLGMMGAPRAATPTAMGLAPRRSALGTGLAVAGIGAAGYGAYKILQDMFSRPAAPQPQMQQGYYPKHAGVDAAIMVFGSAGSPRR